MCRERTGTSTAAAVSYYYGGPQLIGPIVYVKTYI